MQKGFSLIELLVVIGIISILSAIAVPNFMAARERARDATRKADLKAMQSAFELYKQDQTPPEYPASSYFSNALNSDGTGKCWFNGGGTGDFQDSCPSDKTIYLKKLPTDPSFTSSSHKYYYYNSTGQQTYTLEACLENKADAAGHTCPGDFSTYSGSSCSSNWCYQLTQP